ncbi:hypothetical protein H8959_008382 [Pygathrix nigripes]
MFYKSLGLEGKSDEEETQKQRAEGRDIVFVGSALSSQLLEAAAASTKQQVIETQKQRMADANLRPPQSLGLALSSPVSNRKPLAVVSNTARTTQNLAGSRRFPAENDDLTMETEAHCDQGKLPDQLRLLLFPRFRLLVYQMLCADHAVTHSSLDLHYAEDSGVCSTWACVHSALSKSQHVTGNI